MDNSIDKEDNQIDKWQDIETAARSLNVSTRTIRRRIKSGDIESKMRDGKWFVMVDISPNSSTQMSQARLIEQLQSEVQHLRKQVTDLQRLLHQAQVNLDHNQQLLAYAQLPWWRKLGRKALPAAAGDMESGDKD